MCFHAGSYSSIKTKALTGRHKSLLPGCCPVFVSCVSTAHLYVWELVWLLSDRRNYLCSSCHIDGGSPVELCGVDTAHALSVLWTHRYYTHVVAPTRSPTPISPFTSFSCSLAHTAPHPPYTNSLKDSLFTHSYKYKSQPSLPLLSLLATLPLGSMSWSGLKELAPCTWSALFNGHACEWGGLLRAVFLRAHRANLRSRQVEPTFCLFSHGGVIFGLIYFEPFYFSSPCWLFFFSDELLHLIDSWLLSFVFLFA